MVTTAWCPVCRVTREVMDTYDTDDGDRYAENAGQGSGSRTLLAQPLGCGHDANDGGHSTPARPVVHDPTLVSRLVVAQAHTADLRDVQHPAHLAHPPTPNGSSQ